MLIAYVVTVLCVLAPIAGCALLFPCREEFRGRAAYRREVLTWGAASLMAIPSGWAILSPFAFFAWGAL